MSSTVPISPFVPTTADIAGLDENERLRALYKTILDHQERFDEFKQLLALYVLPPGISGEEPEDAARVRMFLNSRIRDWIGPFDGLSVMQTQQWRTLLVEGRWFVAIAPWNSADVASAPGVADRKRAMTELLPAPNSVSSRAETAADSEFASSHPPADNADEVCVASTELAMAMTTAMMATGRRKR